MKSKPIFAPVCSLGLVGLVSLALLTDHAGAQSSGASADVDLSGNVTLQFTRVLDDQGNTVSYSYNGASSVDLHYNLATYVAPIGVLSSFRGDGQTHYWSQSYLWDNPALQVANSVKIVADVAGNGPTPSLQGFVDLADTLQNAGPTEKSVPTPLQISSSSIPGFKVGFSTSITVAFDATLASGSNLILDQTAILQKLTIDSGASFIGRDDMVVRTNFVNHGFAGNLGGTISGNLVNDGDPTQGQRAFINGNLTLQGNLLNTGEIRIESGGTLNQNTFTTNSGTIVVEGGTLNSVGSLRNDGTIKLTSGSVSGDGQLFNRGDFQFSGGLISLKGGLSTSGNFEWSGGGINVGTLTNASAGFTITGAGGKAIQGGGTLANSGTITHVGDANLLFYGYTEYGNIPRDATINNLAGGTYDLQGNGGFAAGNGGNRGTINNAGTFQKSGGAGTSTIGGGVAFNNTGTVEVTSGTLSFQGNVAQQSGNTLTGGTWKVGSNSTLSFAGGNISTNQGVVALSGANSNFTNFNSLADNQGSFSILNGRGFTTAGDLTNAGQIVIGQGSTLNVNGAFVQTASGSLSGKGTLAGDVTASGVIAPGSSPGVLTISGNLTLKPDTILSFELGNPDRLAGDDRIDVFAAAPLTLLNSGNLVLDGTLNVSDLGAFGPGNYVLFTYTGTLTDNGLDIGVLPDGLSGSIIAGGGVVDLLVVPEPSTLWLLGIGALLFAAPPYFLRRHRVQ